MWMKSIKAKALTTTATIATMVGVGFLVVPTSQAATRQPAPSAAAASAAVNSCATFGHTGIQGVVINETNEAIKRTFVEHGPGTGFFDPEPAAEIPAQYVSSRWCVGSRFGVEAMQVRYRLPDHPNSYATFEAYYAAFVGTLRTACSTNTNLYGCAAEKVGISFICTPYVGCVGPLGNESALKDVDVVFRVFPR